MTTHKAFKQRVRARMAKTGESYTAARLQVLRKSDAAATPAPPEQPEVAAARAETPAASDRPVLPTSDEAMRRASGRGYEDWFALLDAWGAAERSHTQIAAWLVSEHRVDGWWAQSITVGWERARGRRALHEMAGGFSVGATRTVSVDAERLLEAFTSLPVRERWLPGAPMRPRATPAAGTARFDWDDPPSRLIVSVVPKGPGKATVAVQHERLPEAAAGERLKAHWRERLAALKALLEGRAPG